MATKEQITENTTIGRVIVLLGDSICPLLDDFFCMNQEGERCCVGCGVTLMHGAHLRGKTPDLEGFIKKLNSLLAAR